MAVGEFHVAQSLNRRVHQSFPKRNATIPEAVRFLPIGHKLKSMQMLQDLLFTVLSGLDTAFAKSQTYDGAGPGHDAQLRDY